MGRWMGCPGAASPSFANPADGYGTMTAAIEALVRVATWVSVHGERRRTRLQCHSLPPSGRRRGCALNKWPSAALSARARLAFEEAAEHTRSHGVLHLAEFPSLDLADTLARHRELSANLVERAIASRGDAEALVGLRIRCRSAR